MIDLMTSMFQRNKPERMRNAIDRNSKNHFEASLVDREFRSILNEVASVIKHISRLSGIMLVILYTAEAYKYDCI